MRILFPALCLGVLFAPSIHAFDDDKPTPGAQVGYELFSEPVDELVDKLQKVSALSDLPKQVKLLKRYFPKGMDKAEQIRFHKRMVRRNWEAAYLRYLMKVAYRPSTCGPNPKLTPEATLNALLEALNEARYTVSKKELPKRCRGLVDWYFPCGLSPRWAGIFTDNLKEDGWSPSFVKSLLDEQ